MLNGLENAMLSGRKEIVLDIDGKKRKLYVTEISYLSSLNIAVQSKQGKNGLALMVAESVVDENGNRMTYDQVIALKKEYAEPLWDAVIEINKVDAQEEKKS